MPQDLKDALWVSRHDVMVYEFRRTYSKPLRRHWLQALTLDALRTNPLQLKDHFYEPERIVICALIERGALRAGGPAKVDVQFKA